MVKALSLTTALALAVGLTAGAASAQVNLTTATASPGSIVNVTTHHLARVAAERGIANLQVQDGATLTNTVLDVAEGRLDMSEAPMILPFLLSRALGPYSAVGEERGAELASSLRALYPFNAGGFGLFAMESANIDSWDDIAGKTIFNGPPRGAALTNARQAVMLAAGLQDGEDYTGFQVNWGQLSSLLTDGSMDAFVFPTVHPSDRVILMQSAGDVVIVSTPREVYESEAYQRIFNFPGNIPIEIPVEDMGYSDGIRITQADDGIYRAMGTAFATVVRADMDYQLAYDLTAAHIETLDELRASTPYAANAGHGILDQRLSGFCGNNQLLYHPGAVAAWEDRGYEVPDCAEPPM
tara:strand:- start:17 stop:1078 length:1062 start_codon:yes stop_codon:yes gene_type:complete